MLKLKKATDWHFFILVEQTTDVQTDFWGTLRGWNAFTRHKMTLLLPVFSAFHHILILFKLVNHMVATSSQIIKYV